MRRVVVTGLGTINPLGNSVGASWNSLIASNSGISKITKFDVENYPCKIAGSIEDLNINDEIVSPREQRKIDRFITLGLIAAEEAILSDRLLFFIGILSLYFIESCTLFGTPALSLPNRIVSFLSNLKLV